MEETIWDNGATIWDAGATHWDVQAEVVIYGSQAGRTSNYSDRPAQFSAGTRTNKQTTSR